MKKIITMIIFLMLVFNLKPIDSKVLSKKIVHQTSQLITKKNSLSYNNYQFFIKQYGKLLDEVDFLKLLEPNFDNDTIFVLMSFGEFFYVNYFQIGIWNKNRELYFQKEDTTQLKFYPDKFDFGRMTLYQADKKFSMFSKHMIYLVSEWDLNELNKESNKYPLFGGGSYVAARIIFKRKKYKIDCLKFSDFYNFERDHTGFEANPDYLKPVTNINRLPFPINKE